MLCEDGLNDFTEQLTPFTNIGSVNYLNVCIMSAVCVGLMCVTYGYKYIKRLCCFVLCSGTAASRTETTVEMEDQHRHSKYCQTHHRQVSLQSHQK